MIQQGTYQYRFQGIKNLYGEGSLEKLKDMHIAVIGIGGVGSWACESLARSGVGKLTIIDLDDICSSNINRQIHALSSTIGKTKVQEMRKRILEVNPECQVNEIEAYYSTKNYDKILSTKYDYIFDTFDDSLKKTHLIVECRRRSQRLLVTGATAARLRPELITISDLAHSSDDKLLGKIKNDLKRHHGLLKLKDHKKKKKKLGVSCIFSTERTLPPNKINNTTCADYGSASFVTASFAFHGVAHILNELLIPASNQNA